MRCISSCTGPLFSPFPPVQIHFGLCQRGIVQEVLGFACLIEQELTELRFPLCILGLGAIQAGDADASVPERVLCSLPFLLFNSPRLGQRGFVHEVLRFAC